MGEDGSGTAPLAAAKRKPSAHAHVYEASVLLHSAFGGQSDGLAVGSAEVIEHSSTSVHVKPSPE